MWPNKCVGLAMNLDHSGASDLECFPSLEINHWLIHVLTVGNVWLANHGHGGWPHWDVDLPLLITGKNNVGPPTETSCFRNKSQTNWGPHIVDPLWMCAGKDSLYWLRNFAVRKPTILHALNHHVYGMYKPSPNSGIGFTTFYENKSVSRIQFYLLAPHMWLKLHTKKGSPRIGFMNISESCHSLFFNVSSCSCLWWLLNHGNCSIKTLSITQPILSQPVLSSCASANHIFSQVWKWKKLSSSLMVCGSQDGLPHISLHVFVKAAIKAATSCQPERKGILPAGLGNDRT